MSRSSPTKPNGHARPIKTERDFKGAASAARTIAKLPDRESTAEKRLQSLLHEMEKFDAAEDEDTSEAADEDSNGGGPRRRWSDDTFEPE